MTDERDDLDRAIDAYEAQLPAFINGGTLPNWPTRQMLGIVRMLKARCDELEGRIASGAADAARAHSRLDRQVSPAALAYALGNPPTDPPEADAGQPGAADAARAFMADHTSRAGAILESPIDYDAPEPTDEDA